MRDKLHAFIDSERDRFSTRDNNRFAFGFSTVARYYQFLRIIIDRYHSASEQWIENFRALQATYRPGTHPMTEQQLALRTTSKERTDLLHLEIESFYLFAKILLDKLANCVLLYFGLERGIRLQSHDYLAKNIRRYARARNLSAPSRDLLDLISELKRDVADYRDKQIAHETSPRTVRGTTVDLDAETVAMSSVRIHPTEHDQQVDSRVPGDVMTSIDRYITEMLKYISANRDKPALELSDEQPQ
jgi:hypothetical protein